ncbi:lysophospholipase L1-like esterase [Rivularia sp. PCC 7116]|uniref:GDSL-type esterase/lipase family protein n=1 Tax=Rivularia sp. PCC 7116 TaxID=373994 RepID=UPI00029EDA8D|nr:GDSL-type esterase/lipase family protein [Rivularia sp. PCC 7116]AFY55917.1 lysophospholipase L1-like esterase [Rivularia sp. PCC 7116]
MKETRICFVGESHINGTGDAECLGWAGRICQNAFSKGFEITYYNLGVRRETSSELRKRWLQEVSYRLPKKYDGRVVFSFGANDTTIENGKTRIYLQDSVTNLRDILSIAKDLYPVLVVSPPPIDDEKQNQRISDLSKGFANVCHELNVPYLDIIPELLKSNIWMDEVKKYDGAHPRAAGYEKFAQIVQNWEGWLNWFK